MIKVLHYGICNHMGGIERYCYEQVKALPDDLHYDFYATETSRPICFEKEFKQMGCKIFYIDNSNRIISRISLIYLFLKHGKDYDVLVMDEAPHLYGMLALFMARITGIRVRVVHIHNSWFSGLNLRQKLVHYLARTWMRMGFATEYWACSKKAGRTMFKTDNFSVIPNAFDVRKFFYNHTAREKLRKRDAFVIGHVGSFNVEKNHEFLFQIFREVLKRRPKAELWLIGSFEVEDSRKQYLLSLLRQYQIEKHVRFWGVKTNVEEWLSAFDVFVFPSRSEGLGSAVVEAQASGLPCIVSDCIPQEAIITKRVKVMSLATPPEAWATAILSAQLENRAEVQATIMKSPYNIQTAMKQLRLKYEKLVATSIAGET